MAMRLIDSDILVYALFQKHDAHPYCWRILQDAIHGTIKASITTISLLEAYHALAHDYLVDHREAYHKLDGLSRSKKIHFVQTTVEIVRKALQISKDHNVRSFDANLIASAEITGTPIIISNDKHTARLCKEGKLILENPIPREVREKMKI